MILSYLLLLGAALWIIGDGMALAATSIGTTSGWIACLGLTLTGCTIWGLKDLPAMARAGRVGIAMTGFAGFTFAMVNIITLTGGVLGALERAEVSYDAVVLTPLYVMAIVFAISGAVGFALHFWKNPVSKPAIGAVFVALAILQFLRLAFAQSLAFQFTASLALACAVMGLALARLGSRS